VGILLGLRHSAFVPVTRSPVRVRLFGVPSCPIAKLLAKNAVGIFCVGDCEGAAVLAKVRFIGIMLPFSGKVYKENIGLFQMLLP